MVVKLSTYGFDFYTQWHSQKCESGAFLPFFLFLLPFCTLHFSLLTFFPFLSFPSPSIFSPSFPVPSFSSPLTSLLLYYPFLPLSPFRSRTPKIQLGDLGEHGELPQWRMGWHNPDKIELGPL